MPVKGNGVQSTLKNDLQLKQEGALKAEKRKSTADRWIFPDFLYILDCFYTQR